MVKNSPAKAGDIRDAGSIPGSGRSPGGRHGNPLQYSCLENPIDRGAWWATVQGVAKRQTLSDSFNTYRTVPLLVCTSFCVTDEVTHGPILPISPVVFTVKLLHSAVI